MRKNSTISTSDTRILNALEPFAAGYAVLVAPPNFICGSNRKHMAWFFEAEADCPFRECRSISWAWTRGGSLADSRVSERGSSSVRRMSRTIEPDIDVDVAGEWYVPRTQGLPNTDYIYFGFSGVYRMSDAGEILETLSVPLVAYAAHDPLVIPSDQLKELHEWFGKYGKGNTVIRWIKMIEYDRPILQVRCVVEDHTTLYFLVSGVLDEKFNEWEGML